MNCSLGWGLVWSRSMSILYCLEYAGAFSTSDERCGTLCAPIMCNIFSSLLIKRCHAHWAKGSDLELNIEPARSTKGNEFKVGKFWMVGCK